LTKWLPTIEIDNGTLAALLGGAPSSDTQIAPAIPTDVVGQRRRRSSFDVMVLLGPRTV
jgi:hypothetical protein